MLLQFVLQHNRKINQNFSPNAIQNLLLTSFQTRRCPFQISSRSLAFDKSQMMTCILTVYDNNMQRMFYMLSYSIFHYKQLYCALEPAYIRSYYLFLPVNFPGRVTFNYIIAHLYSLPHVR